MAIGDFEGTTPPFLPEEFFNGRLEGWGVLESLVPAKAEHNHRRKLLGTHEQAVHFPEICRLSRLNNITSQIGVILQKRLGQRMILVPNAEEAAKGSEAASLSRRVAKDALYSRSSSSSALPCFDREHLTLSLAGVATKMRPAMLGAQRADPGRLGIGLDLGQNRDGHDHASYHCSNRSFARWRWLLWAGRWW